MKYFLTLLALVFASAAQAQITVSGEGSVSVTPDTAILTVWISGHDYTAEKAGAKLTDAVFQFQKTLTNQLNIPKESIITKNISLNPTQNSKKEDIYQAITSLQVTLTDFNLIYKVVSKAEGIQHLQFVSSKTSLALNEARAEAMKDARKKAELYASAAGATLGKVLKIEESNTSRAYYERGDIQAASIPTVQAGSQSVRVSVIVTWAIETERPLQVAPPSVLPIK